MIQQKYLTLNIADKNIQKLPPQSQIYISGIYHFSVEFKQKCKSSTAKYYFLQQIQNLKTIRLYGTGCLVSGNMFMQYATIICSMSKTINLELLNTFINIYQKHL